VSIASHGTRMCEGPRSYNMVDLPPHYAIKKKWRTR
jgi:hypothetical protein